MKRKHILEIILSAVIVITCLPICVNAADSDQLEFGSDGKFTILQLSDPQDDQYPAKELKTFIEKSIESTNPDLIVVTGDIVEDSRFGDIGSDNKNFQEGVCVYQKNGDLDYDATLANVKVATDATFSVIESYGIPFTVAMGNNDYKSGILNEDWLKIFASYPHCIAVDESNDSQGKIDSYIEIAKHGSTDAGFGLWMLDNGKSFTDEQLQWFKDKETSNVPSIVFEHVPVDDVGNLFEPCHFWDEGALAKSAKTYRLNKDIANGTYYCILTPGTTTAEFNAWKDKGVVGAFFGHLHTDGYTGKWDGITLGLTYGFEFAKAGPYGFRTITLDEDGTFETDLFTYSKGEISPQTYEPYSTTSSKFVTFLKNFLNVFVFIYNSIVALLKF